MENNITDLNKRAVDGHARCGISLEGLCDAFSRFPVIEVQEIYKRIHRGGDRYSFGRVFFDPADIEYPDHKRDRPGSRGVLSELL